MSHVLYVLRDMSVLQSVYGYSYSRDPEHIRHECTTEISLLNAADCLYYRFNRQEWVRYIWAVGLLAAGQSSTMTVSATTCTCALYLHLHSTCTCTCIYMNAGNIFISEYIDVRLNRLVQVHVVEHWPRNLVVRGSISGRLNSVQG